MEDMKLPDGTIIPASQIYQDIRDQGSVIVFDSRDFHRVTPVTKGTRYSIVCWTVGPNFVQEFIMETLEGMTTMLKVLGIVLVAVWVVYLCRSDKTK